MVAGYRVLLVEAIAARLILNITSVILANLVLGENVVPEFLQWHCTPKRLAAALLPLLTDTSERRRQSEAFGRLDAIMEVGKASPSDRSAALVLDIIGGASRVSSEPKVLGQPTA
jgi:lipid-A-disaccharide synthase